MIKFKNPANRQRRLKAGGQSPRCGAASRRCCLQCARWAPSVRGPNVWQSRSMEMHTVRSSSRTVTASPGAHAHTPLSARGRVASAAAMKHPQAGAATAPLRRAASRIAVKGSASPEAATAPRSPRRTPRAVVRQPAPDVAVSAAASINVQLFKEDVNLPYSMRGVRVRSGKVKIPGPRPASSLGASMAGSAAAASVASPAAAIAPPAPSGPLELSEPRPRASLPRSQSVRVMSGPPPAAAAAPVRSPIVRTPRKPGEGFSNALSLMAALDAGIVRSARRSPGKTPDASSATPASPTRRLPRAASAYAMRAAPRRDNASLATAPITAGGAAIAIPAAGTAPAVTTTFPAGAAAAQPPSAAAAPQAVPLRPAVLDVRVMRSASFTTGSAAVHPARAPAPAVLSPVRSLPETAGSEGATGGETAAQMPLRSSVKEAPTPVTAAAGGAVLARVASAGAAAAAGATGAQPFGRPMPHVPTAPAGRAHEQERHARVGGSRVSSRSRSSSGLADDLLDANDSMFSVTTSARGSGARTRVCEPFMRELSVWLSQTAKTASRSPCLTRRSGSWRRLRPSKTNSWAAAPLCTCPPQRPGVCTSRIWWRLWQGMSSWWWWETGWRFERACSTRLAPAVCIVVPADTHKRDG